MMNKFKKYIWLCLVLISTGLFAADMPYLIDDIKGNTFFDTGRLDSTTKDFACAPEFIAFIRKYEEVQAKKEALSQSDLTDLHTSFCSLEAKLRTLSGQDSYKVWEYAKFPASSWAIVKFAQAIFGAEKPTFTLESMGQIPYCAYIQFILMQQILQNIKASIVQKDFASAETLLGYLNGFLLMKEDTHPDRKAAYQQLTKHNIGPVQWANFTREVDLCKKQLLKSMREAKGFLERFEYLEKYGYFQHDSPDERKTYFTSLCTNGHPGLGSDFNAIQDYYTPILIAVDATASKVSVHSYLKYECKTVVRNAYKKDLQRLFMAYATSKNYDELHKMIAASDSDEYVKEIKDDLEVKASFDNAKKVYDRLQEQIDALAQTTQDLKDIVADKTKSLDEKIQDLINKYDEGSLKLDSQDDVVAKIQTVRGDFEKAYLEQYVELLKKVAAEHADRIDLDACKKVISAYDKQRDRVSPASKNAIQSSFKKVCEDRTKTSSDTVARKYWILLKKAKNDADVPTIELLVKQYNALRAHYTSLMAENLVELVTADQLRNAIEEAKTGSEGNAQTLVADLDNFQTKLQKVIDSAQHALGDPRCQDTALQSAIKAEKIKLEAEIKKIKDALVIVRAYHPGSSLPSFAAEKQAAQALLIQNNVKQIKYLTSDDCMKRLIARQILLGLPYSFKALAWNDADVDVQAIKNHHRNIQNWFDAVLAYHTSFVDGTAHTVNGKVVLYKSPVGSVHPLIKYVPGALRDGAGRMELADYSAFVARASKSLFKDAASATTYSCLMLEQNDILFGLVMELMVEGMLTRLQGYDDDFVGHNISEIEVVYSFCKKYEIHLQGQYRDWLNDVEKKILLAQLRAELQNLLNIRMHGAAPHCMDKIVSATSYKNTMDALRSEARPDLQTDYNVEALFSEHAYRTFDEWVIQTQRFDTWLIEIKQNIEKNKNETVSEAERSNAEKEAKQRYQEVIAAFGVIEGADNVLAGEIVAIKDEIHDAYLYWRLESVSKALDAFEERLEATRPKAQAVDGEEVDAIFKELEAFDPENKITELGKKKDDIVLRQKGWQVTRAAYVNDNNDVRPLFEAFTFNRNLADEAVQKIRSGKRDRTFNEVKHEVQDAQQEFVALRDALNVTHAHSLHLDHYKNDPLYTDFATWKAEVDCILALEEKLDALQDLRKQAEEHGIADEAQDQRIDAVEDKISGTRKVLGRNNDGIEHLFNDNEVQFPELIAAYKQDGRYFNFYSWRNHLMKERTARADIDDQRNKARKTQDTLLKDKKNEVEKNQLIKDADWQDRQQKVADLNQHPELLYGDTPTKQKIRGVSYVTCLVLPFMLFKGKRVRDRFNELKTLFIEEHPDELVNEKALLFQALVDEGLMITSQTMADWKMSLKRFLGVAKKSSVDEDAESVAIEALDQAIEDVAQKVSATDAEEQASEVAAEALHDDGLADLLA